MTCRRDHDAAVMKLYAAHLRDQPALAIERFPQVGEDDVAVLHQRWMNRQSADPAAVVDGADFSVVQIDVIRRATVN